MTTAIWSNVVVGAVIIVLGLVLRLTRISSLDAEDTYEWLPRTGFPYPPVRRDH